MPTNNPWASISARRNLLCSILQKTRRDDRGNQKEIKPPKDIMPDCWLEGIIRRLLCCAIIKISIEIIYIDGCKDFYDETCFIIYVNRVGAWTFSNALNVIKVENDNNKIFYKFDIRHRKSVGASTLQLGPSQITLHLPSTIHVIEIVNLY